MSDAGADHTARSAPFTVAGARIEPDALRISGEKAVCEIEPKVMALMVALAERPGELWSRNELLTRLWAGRRSSDQTLTRIVYLLRKALKDAAAADAAITTVPKRGYRLDAPVHSNGRSRRAGSTQTATPHPFAIAVLPVTDVSGAGESGFLADGLTRDLTTLLSRTPRFRVAPISSVTRLAADYRAVRPAGEVLRVRFIVTATLARAGERIRVRVELADAVDDVLLWAQKYQSEVDQFYEVQEEVVCSISTAIAAKVNIPYSGRLRRSGRFNVSAYERIQTAEALRLNYGREAAAKIINMLQEALEIEPDNPAVRAALAMQISQSVVSQWIEERDAAIRQADALIAHALSDAANDPDVLTAAGVVATMFHRPDEAIVHLQQSVDLNPNDAHALAVLGWQRCLRHADANGIGLIETAEKRAPHHPRFGLWATYRATGHLFMLNYQEGLRGARQAIARTPNYYQPHLTCAWAHAGLNQTEPARQQIALARNLDADDILEKFVVEMRKWSGNSPNRQACWRVLDSLLELGT